MEYISTTEFKEYYLSSIKNNSGLQYKLIDEVISRLDRIIPNKCFYCGSELIIENMTLLLCPNEECPVTVARKIENMFKVLGIEGFGISLCMDLVLENNLKKCYEVFDLQWYNMPSRYTDEQKKKLYNEIMSKKEQPYYLHTILKAIGLPGISDSIIKLVTPGMSFDSLMEKIRTQGQGYIGRCLGISIGSKTEQVCNTFIEYESYIREALKRFNIKNDEDIGNDTYIIEIAITGGVNGFGSKDEFVEYVNGLLKDSNIYVVRSNSVTKKTKLLISEDMASTSKKMQNARKYGIPILTSKQFLDIVNNHTEDLKNL